MITNLLWESTGMVNNHTTLNLSDSIDNYDEIRYYGSALREGTTYTNVITEYPVVPGEINLGGPYSFGLWDSSLFVLNNGTQCWLSGNSGYINSSYYWGQNNSTTTTYGAALVNNRANDVRPYKIVGVKYDNKDDRTTIWTSTGNAYNIGFTLDEQVNNFESIEIYASGKENSTNGVHLGKVTYNIQDAVMGCDTYGYSPWVTGFNYILGSDFKIYKNRAFCGSSYFMGMNNNSTAWAAGKWVDDNAAKMLQPYKIIGVKRISDTHIEPPSFNVTLSQQTGGTISVNKTSGIFGDIVTLSNTPATEYTFNSYSLTGSSLTGNQFLINDENVTAKGTFSQKTYTLTLQTDGHGKLAASKTTGHKGDTVTLTPTYSSYYRFNNYSHTGGSISNNTFTFGSQNATAKANFKVNAFTASGDFGTCQYSGKDGVKSCTANGILRGHTAVSWPSNWPANGSTWNVSNANSYGIKANTTWQVTGTAVTGYGCVVLGGAIKKTSNGLATGTIHSVNFTANMPVNSTQGKLTISGQKKPATTSYTSLIKKTAGSWTATGYAP